MKRHTIWRLAAFLMVCSAVTACGPSDPGEADDPTPALQPQPLTGSTPRDKVLEANSEAPSPPLVAAARAQIGKTTIYDGAYVRLDYPGGDVPLERGVCTDVVVRALRDAYAMDLQQLVHEDMAAHFDAYPDRWGLTRPDRNIDHRRVPNLRTYFTRQRYQVSAHHNSIRRFEPGDVVTCNVGNRPHIMIVSDRRSDAGVPLVIHNIGRGTVEEDRLHAFTLTGHFRVPQRSP